MCFQSAQSGTGPGAVKVLVLWSRTSGYAEACWTQFAALDLDMSVVVCALSADGSARRREVSDRLRIEEHPRDFIGDPGFVSRLVRSVAPDIVVISGWWNTAYRRIARSGIPYVVCIDNAFEPRPKTILLRCRYGRFLRNAERVFVPGEHSRQLVSMLGVSSERISQRMYGVGVADTVTPQWERRFLFVGQLIERKGVDVLLAAYAKYRETASAPFELHICGDGALKTRVRMSPVVYHGHLDYEKVSVLRMRCPVAVLPSRKDHWPLAIVEAVAAGQAVICTDRCGSATEVVRAGWNGLITRPGDVDELASALHRAADLHDAGLAFGERGKGLAGPYTAAAWAEHWSREILMILEGVNEV